MVLKFAKKNREIYYQRIIDDILATNILLFNIFCTSPVLAALQFRPTLQLPKTAEIYKYCARFIFGCLMIKSMFKDCFLCGCVFQTTLCFKGVVNKCGPCVQLWLHTSTDFPFSCGGLANTQGNMARKVVLSFSIQVLVVGFHIVPTAPH